MSFAFTFLSVLSFFIGFVLLIMGGVAPWAKVLCWVFFALAVFCAIVSCVAKYRSEHPKDVTGVKRGRKRYSIDGYCLSGLPFGECQCNVTVYNDSIVFSANNNTSSLSMEKLISAAVKTKSELTNASTGSAILGAAVFGVVGAIIASRPKKKSEYILILNYFSGETKTIAIAFDSYQKIDVENIAFFLNKNVPQHAHTEL